MKARLVLLPILLATVAVSACGRGDGEHPRVSSATARELTQRTLSGLREDGRVTTWSCPSLELDFGAQPTYECDAAVSVHEQSFRYRVEVRRVQRAYRVRFIEVDGESIERDIGRSIKAVGGRVSCPRWLDLRERDSYCDAALRDDSRVRIRVVPTFAGGLRYVPFGRPATMFEQAISLYIAAAVTATESVEVSCPEGTTFGREVRCHGIRTVRGHRFHYEIVGRLGQPGHLFPEGLRISSPDDHTGEVVS